MGTFDLAHEFAGIAAQEITERLCLADSEAFQLICDCCRAAILGTIIRLRCDVLEEKQASDVLSGMLEEKHEPSINP